jgi:hypothetical protein
MIRDLSKDLFPPRPFGRTGTKEMADGGLRYWIEPTGEKPYRGSHMTTSHGAVGAEDT